MDLNIFLPDDLNIAKNYKVESVIVQISDNLWGIFIIDHNLHKPLPEELIRCNYDTVNLRKYDKIYCDIIVDGSTGSRNLVLTNFNNYLHIRMENGKFSINHLVINKQILDVKDDIRNNVFLFYNYLEFSKTENLFSSSECKEAQIKTNDVLRMNQFNLLKKLISPTIDIDYKNDLESENDKNNVFLCLFSNLIGFLTSYSKLLLHITNIGKFIYWIVYSIWKERRISVKTGNFILALIINFIFGVIILHWINQQLPNLENDFLQIIKDIIAYLKTLLTWLMGSPAGLKLNRTFNNLLGKFFLNNIDLWWKFLEISRDVLEFALQTFKYLGMLGVTFQTAILADLVSFASLHIYCIYIYAARLYNVQISGIIALWRLFLGKKYNPLRGGVDTCEYNYHQLFIGTLAFTILLFLLPTTLMYYVVFTIFRVLIMMLTEVLVRIQMNILSFPVYSLLLWLVRSNKIAGNVRIILQQDMTVQNNLVVLLVRLKTVSLSNIMKTYKTIPLQLPKQANWSEIISKMGKGSVLHSV